MTIINKATRFRLGDMAAAKGYELDLEQPWEDQIAGNVFATLRDAATRTVYYEVVGCGKSPDLVTMSVSSREGCGIDVVHKDLGFVSGNDRIAAVEAAIKKLPDLRDNS